MVDPSVIGPEGALERYRTDLTQSQARDKVADQRLEEARVEASAATAERAALQSQAIAAIETTGDPGSQPVLEAVMQAKGKEPGAVNDYFDHVGSIEETGQPVVVIGAIASSGAVTVIYGKTPDEGGDIRFVKPEEDSDLGQRLVKIPLFGGASFSSSLDQAGERLPPISMYGPAVPEVQVRVGVNHDHPFEKIHFTASADDLRAEAYSAAEADHIEATDQVAMKAIGLPTVVAYGDEAVREASSRLAMVGDARHKVIIASSLESIGVDIADMDELSVEPMKGLKMYFGRQFDSALRQYLLFSSMDIKEIVSDYIDHEKQASGEQLAFLAGIMERLEAPVPAVDLLGSITASLKECLHAERDENGSFFVAVDNNGNETKTEVNRVLSELNGYGLDLGVDELQVDKAVLGLEIAALEKEMSHYSRMFESYSRKQIKDGLRIRKEALVRVESEEASEAEWQKL